ncbi:hypothetical protein [Chondrinema litorale]|uniref:hypothetical protein n=1 Tax=Chondrinema litorale TaxID=2994555 RepID=UPI002543001B|nr:hypothetical protein [Chondrinema litorale]UZR95625.1 hypothetical protein OQ292_07360 [Chondrinema litorale]
MSLQHFTIKRIIILLCFCYVHISAKAQIHVDSLKVKPGWVASLELVNFTDNYPAFLISGERFINEYFGVLLEAGPILAPENFNEEAAFDRYIGFKSRAEFKLYYHYNHNKKLRDFFSLDAGYHGDWYKITYDISYTDYFRIEQGTFHRRIIDFHLRWGRQRFLLKSERLILEWSFGAGLQNLRLKEPESDGSVFFQSDITTFTDIEPISFNARLKIGYLLSK